MDAWGAGGRTGRLTWSSLSSGAGGGGLGRALQDSDGGAATEGRAGQTGKSALAGGTGGLRSGRDVGGGCRAEIRRQCEDKAGCPREVSWAERGRRPWGMETRLGALRLQPYLCSGAESLVPTVAGAPWGEPWKGWLFSCDFSEEEEHST